MKKIYTTFILCILCAAITAQTITGTVTDGITKEALIGVNIILESGNGTSSDIDGKYSLELKNETTKWTGTDAKVTFKYIGYQNVVKNISIAKNEIKNINVSLSPSSEQLSTVVVSAGRFEQKIEEITVSMEVIKPTLIENKNTTDIQTAMDQIPGVNITDGQANIRGGSGWSYGAGTRVLVLVDDMPLISGDAGQVQWKLIATENINQVEVIKGAASALYGSSALNGIINIRTAFPSQKDINKNKLPGYTKVNMHFGVIDKAKREELNWSEKTRYFRGVEFLQAMKFDNLDLSLGGNIFKDDGYREGEMIDRKRFNINSTYRSKEITGLSYGLNGNFLFQTSGSVLIWKSLDEAYIPLGNEITTTNGDTYNIDPFVTYIDGENRHSLKTRYLKVINDNSTKGEDNNQDNESEIYYSDYQWQRNIEELRLRITTGTTNEIVYGRSDLFQGNNSRKNHSLYTQVDKKWNRLNLSLGARYEMFSIDSETMHLIDGDSINHFAAGKPVLRAGVNYQLGEYTFLRSSLGQGYRFPSMAELFITANQSGLEIYPNPDLKPESGWSAEIGIKQALKIGDWVGYLDVAGFLMQYDDMMEFSFGQWGALTDPMAGLGFKSINIGKTQIAGVEFSTTGQGKITNNLTMNFLAGYTFMDASSLEPDEIYATGTYGAEYTYNNSSSDPTTLKYRYKHIAKIDAELAHKKISIGTSFRYNSFMENIDWIFTSTTINGNYEDNPLRDDQSTWPGGNVVFDTDPGMIPGINAAREKFSGGDFIIDARIGYQVNHILRCGFVVNNLLNREYMTRPATMMPPRTFAFQCNFKI